MIDGAYASFRHPSGDAADPARRQPHFPARALHGPTLSPSKERGDAVLEPRRRTTSWRSAARAIATIVGATSGDTGGAAVEAAKGRERVDVFIGMYPHGRVSDVQRRQMTTVNDPNVHAIAGRDLRRRRAS